MNIFLKMAAVTLFGLTAPLAQADTPLQRVKGTISAVDQTTLTVNAADGSKIILALAPGYRLIALTAAKLSDIKPGDFVGVGSVPGPDGKQSAVEVTIFPPAMAGTGEGSRPWDVEPQGTMTNATVQNAVTGVGDHQLTLKYAGGEKSILVSDATAIVAISPGTPADLVPGAAVSVRASQAADNTLTAKAVFVGRGGVVPPT